MTRARISNAALLEHVEQTRRKEELEREPYLQLFRASAEEIQQKKVEAEALAAVMQQSLCMSADRANRAKFWVFAERVTQCARESVRFERWFDKNVRGW